MINKVFKEHKFVTTAVLGWACWLITVVVLRVTNPEIITKIGGSGATIVGSVIGILATVVAFYQWSRNKKKK